MRGNLSPDLIELLQSEEGRKSVYKALTTGHAEVTIGEDKYEITVLGHKNGIQSHNGMEATLKSEQTR